MVICRDTLSDASALATGTKGILTDIIILSILMILVVVLGVFLSYLFLFMIEKESKSEKWLGYLLGATIVGMVIIPPLISKDPNEIKEALLLIGVMGIFGLIERLMHKKIKIHPLLSAILWLWVFWYACYLIMGTEDDSFMNMGIFFTFFIALNYFIKNLLDKYKNRVKLSQFLKIIIATVYFGLIFGVFRVLHGPYKP